MLYASEIGAYYIECSALINYNIQEIFEHIIDKLPIKQDKPGIKLVDDYEESPPQKYNCANLPCGKKT